MVKQVQNRFGETALDFLIDRINVDIAMLERMIDENGATRDDEIRFETLHEFLDMIHDAKQDFKNSLQVEPDPMLDSQLG